MRTTFFKLPLVSCPVLTRTLLAVASSAMLALFTQTAAAHPIITSVVETGGDNEATDTVPAKWTGVTFPVTIANEPVTGLTVGTLYTVGVFGDFAPSFVDRNHRFTHATPPLIPSYLVGQEYIMSGNDNRDNLTYTLDVTVSVPVTVYLLIDNRLANSSNADPPSFGVTNMQWVLDEAWLPVITGANRAGNPAFPDEVGIDEAADGTINQWYSVYSKGYGAGTFRLKQADNATRNMYGVVVQPALLDKVAQLGRNRVGSTTYNGASVGGESYTIVGGGNDIWENVDEFTFRYTEVLGNFDVKVRVESLSANATHTKGGIMVRESLAEDSRMLFALAKPPPVAACAGGTGGNVVRLGYRTGLLINDASGNGDRFNDDINDGRHEDGVGTPQYPNAWIRLVREGNVFTAYTGTDGTTWTVVASQDTGAGNWINGAEMRPVANKVLLGLGVSRHSGALPACGTATGEFRDFMLMGDSRFCLSGADSLGCSNQIRLTFSRPVGANALDVGSYSFAGGGQFINSVQAGSTPNTVVLNTDDLTEGSVYTVTAVSVTDNQNNPIDPACNVATFKHAEGYLVQKVHLVYNQGPSANNSFGPNYLNGLQNWYFQTLAYQEGHPVATSGQPTYHSNPTHFEDGPSAIVDNDFHETYLVRIIGVLQIHTTGDYKFAVSSDDGGALFLSTDDNPANKVEIAREPEWSGTRLWTGEGAGGGRGPNACAPAGTANQSCPIPLVAGGRYYLEYVVAEGGGGNHSAVTWDAGTGTFPANGGGMLATDPADPVWQGKGELVPVRWNRNNTFYNLGAVTIVSEPQDATALVGSPASFTVALDGAPPYEITWRRNGAVIVGASGARLTIPAVQDVDNGATYSATIVNSWGQATTRTATLTVLLNPRITGAASRGNCHAVFVNFNKPMALDGTYTMICSNNVAGATPTAVTLSNIRHGATTSQIRLDVSPDLLPDTNTYYITVTGAHGQDGLIIEPNPTTVAFIHGAEYPFAPPADGSASLLVASDFEGGTISWRQWNGLNQQSGGIPTFMTDPRYTSGEPPPDRDVTVPAFETPGGENGANYGAEIKGTWIVPATGTYQFWLSADDQAIAFIATDANPANMVPLAREPGWANYRAYRNGRSPTDNAGRGSPPVNSSALHNLTAGQRVYLQADWIEGGGGDHFAMTFTTRRVAPNGQTFTRLCDVFCNPGPTDQTVIVGRTATFTATPDGTPPFSMQWSKNGTPIPGATNSSYTTPPTVAGDDMATFTFSISNEFSMTSCSAVLRVQNIPEVVRCTTLGDPNAVYVFYNKPVMANGTYSIIIRSGPDAGLPLMVHGAAVWTNNSIIKVSTDFLAPHTTFELTIMGVTDTAMPANTIVPNPTICLFTQGPEVCEDFSGGLPAGSVSSGTTPPYVLNGVLHLTDRVNSQANYWTVPLGATRTLPSLFGRWRTFIEGVGGADGMSFNVGQNLGTAYTPEEGAGNGLSVQVDTFNNGAADAGVEIKWNGVRVGFVPVGPGVDGSGAPAELALGRFVDTSVEVTPGGFVTFRYDTHVVTGQIPDYTGITANQYAFAARTGGANENAWIDDVCLDLGNSLGDAGVTIANCPSAPVAECSSVTLSALATGSPTHVYQWFRGGVAITGATGPTYTTPPLRCPADQGVVYEVRVSNAFSGPAAAQCTINIACDTTAPTIVGAGSLNGTSIGVGFSEALESASATAAANYSINGGAPGAGIASVTLMPSGTAVTITLTDPLTGCDFTVASTGVRDACAGNSGTSMASGKVAGLLAQALGTPAVAGTIVPIGDGAFEVTAGGADIWGMADQGHFAYAPRTGDFDVRVQVQSLEVVNRWSKAGLMARATLDANSPHVMSVFTPFGATTQDNSGAGADGIDAGARLTPGGNTDPWGGLGTPVMSAGINWTRLTRTGNRIIGRHSTDGVNWTQHADTMDTPSMPATLLVGMATTSHNNGAGFDATAQYRHFSISSTLSYVRNGNNLTISVNDPCAVIQGATDISGPWIDLGRGPLPVSMTPPPQMRFFRTCRPVGP